MSKLRIKEIFASHKTISIIDQAVISGSTFCLSYFAALKYNKLEFGAFAFLLSLSNYTFTFYSALITQPYQIALKENNRPTLIKEASILTVAYVLVSIFIFVLYFKISKEAISNFLKVNFLIFCILYLTQELFRRIEQSDLNYTKLLIGDLIAYGVRVIPIIAIFFTNSENIGYLFIISSSCYFFSVVYFLRGKNLFEHLKESQLSFSMLNEGKWLFVNALISFLSGQVYILFIANFQGVEQVGIVSALIIPIGLLRPISISAEGYLISKVSKIDTKKQWKVFLKESSFFYAPIFLLLSFMLCFPRFILNLFFNGRFNEYSSVFGLVVIYSLLSITLSFIGYYFRLRFDVRSLFRFNIIALILTLPWGWWITVNFGITGMFIVMIVNTLINLLFAIISLQKKYIAVNLTYK